ncbi:uncharacterized protein C12orf60 homolog [Eudromia elegans]
MLARLGFESDKQRLLRASQDLYDLIYIYISSTNTIFRILNEHLGTNLPIISVKENFSIKENLQLLVESLKEMQVIVETKDKDVQENISHSLYAKIAGRMSSLQDKIAIVKDLYDNYKGVLGSIMGAVIAVTLKNDKLCDAVESAVHQLLNSPALCLQVSELLMDYADIAKALPQNDAPSTTKGSSSSKGTPEKINPSSQSSRSSLLTFIQLILRGHKSVKKTLNTAADYFEEAVRVLRPPCEAFHSFVKMVEAFLPLITQKSQET